MRHVVPWLQPNGYYAIESLRNDILAIVPWLQPNGIPKECRDCVYWSFDARCPACNRCWDQRYTHGVFSAWVPVGCLIPLDEEQVTF